MLDYQKEFIEADQRVNLMHNTVKGASLKIFPVPEDENNKWISAFDYRKEHYNEKIKDTMYQSFVNQSFNLYLYRLNNAKQSGDFTEANKILDAFKRNQVKLGSEVMLSDKKINTEILYNKYDIFKNLHYAYMLSLIHI